MYMVFYSDECGLCLPMGNDPEGGGDSMGGTLHDIQMPVLHGDVHTHSGEADNLLSLLRKQAGMGTSSWWATEPNIPRVSIGVKNRVDRLKAISNGQVPAVAALAWSILSDSRNFPPD